MSHDLYMTLLQCHANSCGDDRANAQYALSQGVLLVNPADLVYLIDVKAQAFFSPLPFFAFFRLLLSRFRNPCIPALHVSAYRAKNSSICAGSTTVLSLTLSAFFLRSTLCVLPSVARTRIGRGCDGWVSHSGAAAISVGDGVSMRSCDTVTVSGNHLVWARLCARRFCVRYTLPWPDFWCVSRRAARPVKNCPCQ